MLAGFGLFVVVVVGGLLAISLHSRKHPHDTPSEVTAAGRAVVGDSVPTVRAKTIDGSTVSLDTYRGRPLIVTFGASWCHPCRDEYPMLVRAQAQHPDLAVVGVMYQDLVMDERRILREFHARWPAIDDPTGAIAGPFGVKAVPQLFFITPEGTVQDRVYGEVSAKEFGQRLDRLLAAR